MDFSDIARQRMHAQLLVRKLDDPLAVIRHFGAMQAQDFKAAKWALGLRSNATDADIEKLFDEGEILRVHALRPTWHFVLPEDIRWMQALTGERVLKMTDSYYRKLLLTQPGLEQVTAQLAQELKGGRMMTVADLRAFYERHGYDTSTMALSFLTIYARVTGVICSGPLQGKQHTVMLLEERAPQAKNLSRQEALVELTRRFFAAHGPATSQDFAWWSSLLAADIKTGIANAHLKSTVIDGVTFYFTSATSSDIPSPMAQLLPNYDEFTVAYKERRPFIPEVIRDHLIFKNMGLHQIIVDSQLVGNWRWTTGLAIELQYITTLSQKQKQAIYKAVDELGRFFAVPISYTEHQIF